MPDAPLASIRSRYSLPPVPAYTPVRLPLSASGSIPASSRASQLVSSIIRCCGSIMRASMGEMRKNLESNHSMSSTNAPRTCSVSCAWGSPTALLQSFPLPRPSVIASMPDAIMRQYSSRFFAPGSRQAIPTMAMASFSTPVIGRGPGVVAAGVVGAS